MYFVKSEAVRDQKTKSAMRFKRKESDQNKKEKRSKLEPKQTLQTLNPS